MNRSILVASIAALAAAAGLGYWWGTRTAGPGDSPAPAGQGTSSAAEPARGERRILFYRNPMGLPDTSPVPKKDSMGMDYVPVYADEAPAGPGFVVPADRLQRLGVRTQEAGPHHFVARVHALGTVRIDERLRAVVSTKFEGYVTRLHVATAGTPVRRGQPLLEVYSPELVSAQEEYLVAARNLREQQSAGPELRARFEQLVAASAARLRNWDIEPGDLPGLASGQVRRNVLLRSPVDGVVIDEPARVGQRFVPGEALYQVAGLSRVWLMADVFEQDLAAITDGAAARATFDAWPGRGFEGRVGLASLALDEATRTLAVRIELPNPGGALKPGLFGNVEIEGRATHADVAVPDSAVLDSGMRRLVFVARPGGRFEPREVTLGARGDGRVAVLAGLAAGEPVVVDGNFLIDAESNLRAGLQALGHVHGDGSPTGPASATPEAGAGHDAHAGHAAPPAATADTHDAHRNH